MHCAVMPHLHRKRQQQAASRETNSTSGTTYRRNYMQSTDFSSIPHPIQTSELPEIHQVPIVEEEQAQACANTSIDSVFVSRPASTVSSDPGQHAKPAAKCLEPRRLILPSDSGAAVCRICHSSEKSCPFSDGEPLISPCDCRGSTGLYHRTCLERWLSTANKDKCEICQFAYLIERTPKTWFEFIKNPGSKSIRRHMISDFICWLILTPTAAVGSWLCISGAITPTKPEQVDRVPIPTLAGLAAFLIMTYLVWSAVCIRYHVRVYGRWAMRNYRVRIILDSEKRKKAKQRPVSVLADQPNSDESESNHGIQSPRTPDVDPQPPVHAGIQFSTSTHYSTPWANHHRQIVHPPITPYSDQAQLDSEPTPAGQVSPNHDDWQEMVV